MLSWFESCFIKYIAVFALMLPFAGLAQNKKAATRSISDSLRSDILRRDSMMRYYKTSDTSTNNLLQRIEYYTLSFNQINNHLSKRLDTVDISQKLPRLEKSTVTIRNLIMRDRSGTLRYLYAIRDILNKRQDQLNIWQEELKAINEKLADINEQITYVNRDSMFRVFPADSTLRSTFLKQRSGIETKAHKLDSVNKKALLRIGLMQNRVTSVYINILEEKDLINSKIRAFGLNALNCEYGYIWNMKPAVGTTFLSSWDRTVNMNLRLFRLLNDETLMHLLGFIIFFSYLSWLTYNRRKIIKTKSDPKNVFAQTKYVAIYPVTVSLLLTSLIIPYLYNQPPMAFLEIVSLVSMGCVVFITFKTCPKEHFNLLGKLFGLTLIYSISNLFVEVSNVDRVAVLIVASTIIWQCWLVLKRNAASYQLDIPYSKLALTLLIILQAASVLLNIAGRFSLAKIIGVTAVYNFWLALCLYYFVQIIIQSMFLQLEANKTDKDSISSYLDFKLLQGKLRSILFVISVLMWAVTLLQNLSVEDGVFALIGSFLNQSRKLGGTLFTFGSIIIFVGVVWLSTTLARIITYFYEFVHQHKTADGTQKKARTSLLLIRIGVISIGFLLAVGASGFPLDKITIIISALGVGVGFGLQNIVNNLVSGLILAFEKPVQVGDVIEVASRSGTIKEIGMRSSKIAAGNGAEIIIPNGDLISQHVVNWTLSDSSRQVELMISVAYGCDIEQVKNLLRNLLANRDDIMVKPAPVVYLDHLSQSSVDFKVQFWAADISMWTQLKSKVLSAIYSTLMAEGIDISQGKQEVIVHLPSNIRINENPSDSNL
ncbi:mechanosensitive ion channel domain-containing protein [Mucilaginibacter sp. CSA2-8R]|uniref:mechanosensitive ion channel family protein n=1 Tax=Mucilaginibacter sp. CSA2-8R TaxID=3141542 RepID=UPI00315DEC83